MHESKISETVWGSRVRPISASPKSDEGGKLSFGENLKLINHLNVTKYAEKSRRMMKIMVS